MAHHFSHKDFSLVVLDYFRVNTNPSVFIRTNKCVCMWWRLQSILASVYCVFLNSENMPLKMYYFGDGVEWLIWYYHCKVFIIESHFLMTNCDNNAANITLFRWFPPTARTFFHRDSKEKSWGHHSSIPLNCAVWVDVHRAWSQSCTRQFPSFLSHE